MFLTALTYYQSALFIIWSLFSNWYSSWSYSVLSLVSNFIFVRHNCNNGFVTTSNIDFWWSTNKDISSFQFHSQGHNREQIIYQFIWHNIILVTKKWNLKCFCEYLIFLWIKFAFLQSCNKSVSWYLGYRTFLKENPDILK